MTKLKIFAMSVVATVVVVAISLLDNPAVNIMIGIAFFVIGILVGKFAENTRAKENDDVLQNKLI